jgi:YXYXY domain-containing protein
MRLTITLFFGLLSSFVGLAQNGSYYLAQYDLSDKGLSNYNYDIVQDDRGLIYMANLKGVVVSDGLDWSLIETPYSVFSLAFDDDNNLYVGGRKEIAVIKNASNSLKAYEIISTVKQEVLEITYLGESVYFLTENTLYVYNVLSKSLQTIEKPPSNAFQDIFPYAECVLVVSSESGIQELTDGILQEINTDLPEATLGMKTSSDGSQFVYTSTAKYFIKKSNQSVFTEFVIDDNVYFEQNTPLDIDWVNNNMLVISTLGGGVVFINATTGKVEQYMNYENGLSDNEVLALFVGKNNVVWCGTPHSVSIIAPEIPILNYASYQGLTGNIHVVYDYNDRLFVGTTVGLFELVQKSVFEDIISYKKTTKTEEIVGEVVPKKKKRLFKKNKKNKTPVTITRDKTYYKKRVKKKLLSQSYEYQRIDSVDSKVVQLIEYNGKLLIGTLAGIYELEEQKVKKIFNQPIVYMYAPEKSSFLMVSTYDKEVKVLTESNNSWAETGLLDGLDDLVEQIEKGEDGGMWLCGADSIYRLELNSAYTLDDVEVFPINNPHWERIYANPYYGKTYFLNTSGYYYYEDHTIKKDTLIEKKIGLPTKMILSSNDNLWVNTGHFWYGQGEDLNNSLNFISLFEDPRYISEVDDNNFWVVAGDNQLYKINGDDLSSISRNFELFLEQVKVDSVAMPVANLMGNISQQSSLTFKFASPDYTNIYQTEFQYRLQGFTNEWSEWSHSNDEIVFPYLPAGNYNLEVRARDALGNVKNSESISFGILAPYWKRPWFYLIELIFFGGLMTIAVIINRRTSRFKILSRLLTYLTLIFIVEFVQTIAEAKFETNQSPVINFFIQVAIALSILPIEGVLRKFITKKQEGKVESEKTH